MSTGFLVLAGSPFGWLLRFPLFIRNLGCRFHRFKSNTPLACRQWHLCSFSIVVPVGIIPDAATTSFIENRILSQLWTVLLYQGVYKWVSKRETELLFITYCLFIRAGISIFNSYVVRSLYNYVLKVLIVTHEERPPCLLKTPASIPPFFRSRTNDHNRSP